jgi:DNA-binding response OmpR family regulator
MVVDDNRHMTQLLGTILRSFAIAHVDFQHVPTKAFAMIDDFKPDLLFLDWNMPTFNGAAFTRVLRRDPSSPSPFLPVIVVSAFGDREHVVEARDAGANEFLVKPISASSVYERIVSIIEQPREYVRSSNYVGPCRRRHKDASYRGPERRSAATRKLTQAQIDELIVTRPVSQPAGPS